MKPEFLTNENVRELMKKVSSNLMRAQIEENRDVSVRNKYLEQAGSDSVKLGRLLIELGDCHEASRYFLSAAFSFKKPYAITQARACFQKVIELDEPDFVDQAKVELSQLREIEKDVLDLETKEGRLAALDYLVWKHPAITTPKTQQLFEDEFDREINPSTMRNYAHELEKRRRIVLWGGPQGRVLHMYPNIAELATRSQHYGMTTLVSGIVGARLTNKFTIKLETLKHNKELFIINSSIVPSMLISIDMEGFVKNVKAFARPNFTLKALGSLEKFSDLVNIGYDSSRYREKDVLDSYRLIDHTETTIYDRDT